MSIQAWKRKRRNSYFELDQKQMTSFHHLYFYASVLTTFIHIQKTWARSLLTCLFTNHAAFVWLLVVQYDTQLTGSQQISSVLCRPYLLHHYILTETQQQTLDCLQKIVSQAQMGLGAWQYAIQNTRNTKYTVGAVRLAGTLWSKMSKTH